MNEDERQAFHIFLGLCSMALVYFFGAQMAILAVSTILAVGLVLVHLKLRHHPLGPIDRLVAKFERPGVTPGYGAMTIAAGVLAILTLIPSEPQIHASLIILGFGDAASTLVGTRSKLELPYNKRKTIGGTLAFFIACLPAFYFAGSTALLVAGLAALAEGADTKMDDNLLIPLVCVVAFRLLI